MNDEIIFSDLGEICMPGECISDNGSSEKWRAIPYKAWHISGKMLLAPAKSKPPEVTFSPKLSGWHKIFVGLYGGYERNSEIDIKLSDEQGWRRCGTCTKKKYYDHRIEEIYLSSANMDGQCVIIGKHSADFLEMDAAVAWIRFVRMNDDEVEAYKKAQIETHYKNLYASNDIFTTMALYDMGFSGAWETVVHEYRGTDVEWLAVEDITYSNMKQVTDVDCALPYSYCNNLYKNFNENFSWDKVEKLVSYGQNIGIKMCISRRVASCGMEYPDDFGVFEHDFTANNPQFKCIDRDGVATEYMSFAYSEVQDYIIDKFIRAAETGCDAVQPIFSRGWPLILFEEPFTDAFMQRYGEDARRLPLDDERIITLKCEMMTEFMRKLRRSLDERITDCHVELHAKVLFSVYDNLLVGLDVETWAKEKIVDCIVSDERRIREKLPKSVMCDDDNNKINIEKYKEYTEQSCDPVIVYDYDSIFPPMPDSRGIMRGPKNQSERVFEFSRLECKYGIKAYIEIMPREMPPEEIKRRAIEIYDAGGKHIGLWDTNTRVVRKCEWSQWSRLGHEEELRSGEKGKVEFFSIYRVTELGGKNVKVYQGIWTG